MSQEKIKLPKITRIAINLEESNTSRSFSVQKQQRSTIQQQVLQQEDIAQQRTADVLFYKQKVQERQNCFIIQDYIQNQKIGNKTLNSSRSRDVSYLLELTESKKHLTKQEKQSKDGKNFSAVYKQEIMQEEALNLEGIKKAVKQSHALLFKRKHIQRLLKENKKVDKFDPNDLGPPTGRQEVELLNQ